MMKGVNKLILIGNLGRTPEAKKTHSGDFICNVPLATNFSKRDPKTGYNESTTEWHDLMFFGNKARTISEFAEKGTLLYIEGRIQTRKKKNNAGIDVSVKEVIVNTFTMLGYNKNKETRVKRGTEGNSVDDYEI